MLLPGVTGSGESLAVTPRSASGVTYAVFSVSPLSLLLVSLPVALIPKNVLSVPSLRPRIVGLARTTTRICAGSPFAYAGFVHVDCVAPPVIGRGGLVQPAAMVIVWKRYEPLLNTLNV